MKYLLLCLSCLAVLGAEPMFRGNPAHTGVYDSAAPALTAVKWKFQTSGKVFSSPVIAAGVVYFGSTDGNLYAVATADGALRWKFAAGGAVRCTPAVADGAIYVTSLDGNLYSIGLDGKLRWKFQTEGERRFSAPGIHGAVPRTETMPDPFDVFHSSPAVVNGVVYFGSGDHHVYAVNTADGSLKWKFQTGNVVHASPAVAGGVVYIGSWDRNLYALDAATGAVKWKFQTGDDTKIYNQVGIASSAAVVDGTVFFGCRDGHFYAVDAATGKERWNVDNHMGWVIASPAVRGGVVYFPTSDGQRFKAVEAATGKVRFDIGMKAISFSSPALAGNMAYFGTSDGWLHAVDIEAGKIAAEFQTDGSRENAAKWIGPDGKMRNMYPDQTLDGIIIGLERMFSLGSVLSSPAVADGVLYVGSTDGTVYALR